MEKEQVITLLVIFSICVFPCLAETYNDEATAADIVKEREVDIDNDGENELVRATLGPGVSDKPLKIEILRGSKIIDTVHDEFGIQSNYVLKQTAMENLN